MQAIYISFHYGAKYRVVVSGAWILEELTLLKYDVTQEVWKGAMKILVLFSLSWYIRSISMSCLFPLERRYFRRSTSLKVWLHWFRLESSRSFLLCREKFASCSCMPCSVNLHISIVIFASLQSIPYPWKNGMQFNLSSSKPIYRALQTWIEDSIPPTLRGHPVSIIWFGSVELDKDQFLSFLLWFPFQKVFWQCSRNFLHFSCCLLSSNHCNLGLILVPCHIVCSFLLKICPTWTL